MNARITLARHYIKKNSILILLLGILILSVVLIVSIFYLQNLGLKRELSELKSTNESLDKRVSASEKVINEVQTKFLPNYSTILSSFQEVFTSMNVCVAAVTKEQIAECESVKAKIETAKNNYTAKIDENLKIINENKLAEQQPEQ
ncbi:hypothetical protein IPJ91_00490 [bacterium]|nr:MAG: hypothetical protein IPJ91_00490 [bacterium]